MAQKGVSNLFVMLFRSPARPTHANTNQLTALTNPPRNSDLSTVNMGGNSWAGHYYGKQSCATTASSEKLQMLKNWWAQKKIIDDEKEAEREKEKHDTKDSEQEWKGMKLGFVMLGASIVSLGIWTVCETDEPATDVEENVMQDDSDGISAVQQHYYPKIMQDLFKLPKFRFPAAVQRPYTLMLDLKELLGNLDWMHQVFEHCEKYEYSSAKKFLQECIEHIYDIVVFTAEMGLTVLPILDADTHEYVLYRSMRDAIYFIDGHHWTDLSNLKRDLKKVLARETDSNTVTPYSTNIARWLGNKDNAANAVQGKSFFEKIAGVKLNNGYGVPHYYRQMDHPFIHSGANRNRGSAKPNESDE